MIYLIALLRRIQIIRSYVLCGGRTEYIDDNLPYEISDQVFKDYSFKAQKVNLTVFGKCRNCRDN